MITNNVGIIGLGNVGEAVVRSIKSQSALIFRRTLLKLTVKTICDTRSQKRQLSKKYKVGFTRNASDLLNDPQINTVVELIGGIEPAKTFILEALKKGKDVVTANKALLSQHGREIFDMAKKQGKAVGFEASVCGAIPLIHSIEEGLVSSEVNKLYGIVNGTTNYILHQMEQQQKDFCVILKEAQKKGIAEKNPALDIEGKDALHKLCILSYLCFGYWPPVEQVFCEGIKKISLLDVAYAKELNYRIKLLAIAKRKGDNLDLRVHPTLVPMTHPLASISQAFNAVYLDTYPAGPLLFYGQGAGGTPTSSAVVSDIVNIAIKDKDLVPQATEMNLIPMKNIKARYYIRFTAYDQPGVLAAVSRILAAENISIASVNQKEKFSGKYAPLVILTHDAKEENLLKALEAIDRLPVIKGPSQRIRIENFHT